MDYLFSFGKKRRTVKRSSNKKPPASLRKLAKKYRVKISLKKGRRRVYKKISVIKKEIKKKMKKMKKMLKSKSKKRSCRFKFGNISFTFDDISNFILLSNLTSGLLIFSKIRFELSISERYDSFFILSSLSI